MIITIVKTKSLNNDSQLNYKPGFTISGYSPIGLEVGKECLIFQDTEFFHTSKIVEINEQDKTFKTKNSIYSYKYEK